MAKGKMINFTY